MRTTDEHDVLSSLDEDKPCGTSSMDCGESASWAIWTRHNVQGCDYSGFRCAIHYNILLLETQRMISRIERGWTMRCARCGERQVSVNLRDYIRGIQL